MHQLLIKYLNNQCNARELERVLAYLKTEEGQQQLGALMDQEMKEYDQISSQQDADYDQVFKRIKANLQTEKPQEAKQLSMPLYKRWYGVAAVISGFMLISSVYLLIVQQPKATTYQTAYGETRTISLPDGSSVILNANSSIQLLDDFEEQREVWLKGEAFFEIEEVESKDKSGYIKFTVHTDRLDVEVLGTSFNVQDWQEKTQIVLASGKVRLRSSSNQELTMEPGELAEVTKDQQSIQKKIVNPEIYSAWTENRLFCNETPLHEVASTIAHRFGKEVIFQEESLKNVAITGTLPLQNLTLLSDVLQESLTIKIHINEDKLLISKSKEKPAQ
ncbi:FecR family protein [Catalinimonas niigatensis]|uniref:FecR family protein n=1 Tax=Catalinimonas niigatensis TaxID=1397264 RepID=UPI002665E7BD|nr:FecR domain-containing protein [Catalinimonas niigatensis]WPP49198.1 FecR domain-containing protein [Catalinimonas niigatensis]